MVDHKQKSKEGDDNMRECSICLLTERDCQLYKYNEKLYCKDCYDLIKEPINCLDLKVSFERFIKNIKDNNLQLAFALSGGKDSIVALQILIEEYNIRPLVFTIDHGFKNVTIVNNCLHIIEKYKLNWFLHRVEIEVIKTIKKCVSLGELPCIKCNKLWKQRKIYELCQLFKIDKLCMGGDTPILRNAVYLTESIPNVTIALPIVASQITEKEIYERAYRLGWKNPKLEGLDTDCIAVGIALEKYRIRTNRKYHIEEKKHLSQKIRFGLMSKESARKSLSVHKPIAEKEVKLFESIMSE